jgi:hypothetical protein
MGTGAGLGPREKAARSVDGEKAAGPGDGTGLGTGPGAEMGTGEKGAGTDVWSKGTVFATITSSTIVIRIPINSPVNQFII